MALSEAEQRRQRFLANKKEHNGDFHAMLCKKQRLKKIKQFIF